MKKVLVLAVSLAFLLCGCNGDGQPQQDQIKVQVGDMTVFFPNTYHESENFEIGEEAAASGDEFACYEKTGEDNLSGVVFTIMKRMPPEFQSVEEYYDSYRETWSVKQPDSTGTYTTTPLDAEAEEESQTFNLTTSYSEPEISTIDIDGIEAERFDNTMTEITNETGEIREIESTNLLMKKDDAVYHIMIWDNLNDKEELDSIIKDIKLAS